MALTATVPGLVTHCGTTDRQRPVDPLPQSFKLGPQVNDLT